MTIRFLVIGILLSATSFAQINVSGTWTLQNKEHIAGPKYANALPKQMILHQQSDSLIIENIYLNEEGQDVSVRHAVAMNGYPATSTNPTTKKKNVKSLQWAKDKQGLTLTIVYYIPDNPNQVDFTRVETWILSPDGKQLNINKKSIETQSESWEDKGVYDKK